MCVSAQTEISLWEHVNKTCSNCTLSLQAMALEGSSDYHGPTLRQRHAKLVSESGAADLPRAQIWNEKTGSVDVRLQTFGFAEGADVIVALGCKDQLEMAALPIQGESHG